VSGAVRSELSDFSQQLSMFLRACSTAQYPIDIEEPCANQLLHDIAINGSQRVDVAEHLLRQLGTFQDAEHSETCFVDGLTAATPSKYITLCSPGRWNHLRQAIDGSNEKIVRLLLEQVALTNAIVNDVLPLAVRTGSLRSVRLLVNHGADVNRIPKYPIETRPPLRPVSPIAAAIHLEQESIARYLHEHGTTLASTLDDVGESHSQSLLKQYPYSKWRLALLLSQCERGKEQCSGPCIWKAN
jgi:hypothetical protein